MEPTTFRTLQLFANRRTRIIQKFDGFQRAVAFVPTGLAFISNVASELEFFGQGPLGDAYSLPAGQVRTFTAQPGEHVVGISNSEQGVNLHIAVSHAIPRTTRRVGPAKPTALRRYTVPLLGVGSVRIAPGDDVPRRVVITSVAAGVFVGSVPSAFDGVGAGVPGEAILAAAGMILVLAPGQPMFAASTAGGAIDVAVSEVALKE